MFKCLENMIVKLWIFNTKIFLLILGIFTLKNDVPTSNITSIMGHEIQILSPIFSSICTIDVRYSPKVLCNMHKESVETLLKTLRYLSLFNIFQQSFQHTAVKWLGFSSICTKVVDFFVHTLYSGVVK